MPEIDPRDRSIALIVKAKELFNLTVPVTKPLMDELTSIVEDGGFSSGFGNPNKDFETTVFMNKKVCWSIEADDPNGEDKGYIISLDKVFHNPTPSNPNFFNEDPLNVNRKTGKVCGTIARSPLLPDMDDNYTIQFEIRHDISSHQSAIKLFNLDPKLKINIKQK